MNKLSVFSIALVSAFSISAQTPVSQPIGPTTSAPSTAPATPNSTSPTPTNSSTLTTPARPDAVNAPNNSTQNASPSDSNGVIPPASTIVQTAPGGTPAQNGGSQVVQTYAADGQGLANLNMMDANGDGMLSKQEYLTHYERQFSGMKKNTIGLVDLRRMAENGQE